MFDKGNWDYDHGLLPKHHFRESKYNVKNSGAMISEEKTKDRHGVDRSKYHSRPKMRAYGSEASNSSWAFDRHQNTSSSMRRHYLKHTHTRKRQLLKEEMLKELNEHISLK
jgi:hypothetical protein